MPTNQTAGAIGLNVNLLDPASVQWTTYSPETSVVSFGSTLENLSSFDNLNAVGFHLKIVRTDTGNIFINSELDQLTVTGTVIPEASATWLLGLAALGMVVRRRRR